MNAAAATVVERDALNAAQVVDPPADVAAQLDPACAAAPVDMRAFDRRMREAGATARKAGKNAPAVGMACREMPIVPASLDINAREFDVVISTGAQVLRSDWWTGEDYVEVLEISASAIRMGRLNDGAPFLDSHDYYSGLQAMLGVIVPGTARIEKGSLIGRVRLARSDAGDQQLRNVADGILRKVSVGYITHKYAVDDTTAPPTRTSTDWEPYEVSGVTMPADPDASVRSAKSPEPHQRAEPANERENHMTQATAPAAVDPAANTAAIEARASTLANERVIAASNTAAENARKLERERMGAIRAIGAKLKLPTEFIDTHANGDTALEAFRQLAIDEAAKRSNADPTDSANTEATLEAPYVIPGGRKKEYKPGEMAARVVRCIAAGKRNTINPMELAGRVWKDPNLVRALQASVGASGGFMIPEVLSSEIIELLRPVAAVRKMNPTIIPMPQGNISVNRIAGGASGSYVGEGQPAIAQQQSLDQLKLTSKKLIALVPISNDLLKFTSNAADIMVRDDMIAALAQTEDAAFIRGAGTAFTPKGIKNWAGNTTAANGTVNLANVNSDLNTLLNYLTSTTANCRMLRPGWLMSWRTRNYLYSLLNANGMYVFRDEMKLGMLNGFPFAVTNNIPNNLGGGSSSELYLVDFADAVIGEVPGLEIDTSSEASYNTDSTTLKSTFSQDETVIRVIELHDFGMRHDGSAAYLSAVNWV